MDYSFSSYICGIERTVHIKWNILSSQREGIFLWSTIEKGEWKKSDNFLKKIIIIITEYFKITEKSLCQGQLIINTWSNAFFFYFFSSPLKSSKWKIGKKKVSCREREEKLQMPCVTMMHDFNIFLDTSLSLYFFFKKLFAIAACMLPLEPSREKNDCWPFLISLSTFTPPPTVGNGKNWASTWREK